MRKVLCLFLLAYGVALKAEKPRLVMFVGMDISGSFQKTAHYADSINFLANYLYAHLKGLGGLEVPHSLFVGSIGGQKIDEPKTMYPIQAFENASVEEIKKKLEEIFPAKKSNPFTDFNAFFEQISNTIKNKKLLLKPVSIVMISDGIPDAVKVKQKNIFKAMNLSSLEQVSRNITLRLLYTDAVTGQKWLDQVPRKRVKVWKQDAIVMAGWKDPKIFLPDTKIEKQDRFFNWVKDNVDFNARLQRVD
jgi:hypothetical protein